MKIILPSSSHNRQELLKIAGIPYLLDPANIDESIFLESDPKKMTQSIALAKAQAVAKNHSNSLIIAGDTVAVYRHKIMGKPKFKMDALAVLKLTKV